MTEQTFANLLLESPDVGVALVRLNRPKVLNALNDELMAELVTALQQLDADEAVRCIVLTGSERAFAAGADVGEMATAAPFDLHRTGKLRRWQAIGDIRTPVIAAVSGYALGGGLDLALACDTIVASETARFGLPEIQLGVIPGGGSTQRLTRIIGKARAMELILTGRHFTAPEAQQMGLVCRVVPVEEYLASALQLARDIAKQAPLAAGLAKAAVLQADEAFLATGLEYERQLFHLLFASADQREGMAAFLAKRAPEWQGR